MFYIDGHCDTLSKALDEKKDLYENNLQFSLKKANEIGGRNTSDGMFCWQ